jgi:aryl sulfotransferase
MPAPSSDAANGGWTKTKTYESHHFDSGAWDVVKPRDDDIVIATAYKSGTTWMQQIIAQIIFNGEPPAAVGELSPWIDLRVPPRAVKAGMVEGIPGRRFLKTHLPTDALDYNPNTKYVYIARDGRDAFISLMNHYKNGNEAWYGALNSPGLVGDPLPTWDEITAGKREDDAIRALFDKWLNTPWGQHPWEEDGWPFWSLFYNTKKWWEARHLPNVLFVHFSDLKKDLKGQMRRIADFLGCPVDESKFDAQVKACTFEAMKGEAAKVAPLGGALWKGGATTFINKGTNGRWKGILTDEQVKAYQQAAEKRLGKKCAKWLAEGGDVDGKCVIM